MTLHSLGLSAIKYKYGRFKTKVKILLLNSCKLIIEV
jgi:hypothetical protein